MKRWVLPLFALVLMTALTACGDKEPVVTIHTPYGDMKVVLYNQTPEHKESFLRLAESGGYDSTIFHRVIQNFMIQGGDRSRLPEVTTRDANIPLEYNPMLFHRKGALAGARMGERSNPSRASGTQWYIVQGETYNAEDVKAANMRMQVQSMNMLLSMLFMKPEYNELRTRLETLRVELSPEEFTERLFTDPELQQAMAKEFEQPVPNVKYSEEQLEVYATEGGTPHLDGGYTVFGQVIDGMEVIDKIAAVRTSRGQSGYMPDQPLEDIKLYMTIELVPIKEIEKQYGFVFPGAKSTESM